MVQGVLFDMDGVLFDTESLGISILTQCALDMGGTVPEDLAQQICGASNERFREVILQHNGPGFNFDEYERMGHQRMEKALESEVPMKPGVLQALVYLRENGYKTAIASSSKCGTIQRYIHSAGLEKYFDAIVGGDMVKHYKPAPDSFLQAAAALGLAPEDCVAVEDSVNGIKSASTAGCVTVMVPDMMPATDELRAICAAVLPSLRELPAFMEGLRK